jgi:hypothetical protein
MTNTRRTIYRALQVIALVLLLIALGTTQAAGADPHVAAATYLGGSGTDYGRAVGLDAQGNIYLAGDSFSASVLGQNMNRKGSEDILVAKLNPDATRLLGLFSIGSTSTDRLGGMAVTPLGEVVLTVETDNPDFPTKNAVHPAPANSNPGVLLKINAALDGLVFSTFTSFTIDYGLQNVAVDGAGNISVIGYVYDPSIVARDLVLQKYSPDGQHLLFEHIWDADRTSERAQALAVRPDGATYIAGYTEGRFGDFAVTDNAFQKVCGRKLALGDDRDCDQDAFVMRLDSAGTVTYASYLGGEGSDSAVSLAVDAQGAIYLTGSTTAIDFPTTAGAFQPNCPLAKPEDGCYYDAFVAKLAPDGSRLIYSTYLASDDLGGLDYPAGIAVDGQGNATVVGTTASERWPTKSPIQAVLNAFPCPNAFQDRLCFDSFITTLTPDGQLAFSSYLGGKFDEQSAAVTTGADGSIYMIGTTSSLDYPTTMGVVQPAVASPGEVFLATIMRGTNVLPPGKHRVYLPMLLQ